MDAGLNRLRDIGVTVARSLGRVHTNFWFLDWNEGAEGVTWIMSSGIALCALGLVPFLAPLHASIRPLSALVLLGGVALARTYVPWAPAYGDRAPGGIQIVFFGPVVALAAWHLLAFRAARALSPTPAVPAVRLPRVPAASAVLLSAALFISPTAFPPGDMVVTRRVIGLDVTTGDRLWATDVFTTEPEEKSPMNSHATPTPVVVGDIIVATFGAGLAALDVEGRVLWSTLSADWIDHSLYGAGSSPVTNGRAVFVALDREYESQRQSRVVAYSPRTGEELWARTPDFAHDGYATPVVYRDGDREQLLTLTSKTVTSYDAASGEIVWRLEIPVSTPIPSLVVDADRFYVTGGRGSDAHTAAYRLRGRAAPEMLWASRQSPADVASPVLYKDRLYTISSGGVMVSYRADTGDVVWRRRVGSGLGVFYASLVAADDKVYAVRSNGTTYVIAASDEFRVVGQSALDEEIFASPAFSAGCLMLRTASALYCIGAEGGEPRLTRF